MKPVSQQISTHGSKLKLWVRPTVVTSMAPCWKFSRRKNGVDSLAVLQEAAIKSIETEYFDVIIMQMNNAVQPGLGETMSEDSRTAFENAILAIAAKAPSKALILAQQLNSVNSTRSGELLKITYADRLKDGLLSYGVVAVEAGECKGKKQAALHVATVTDPAKRMVVLQDATGPIRTVQPETQKCETGEWYSYRLNRLEVQNSMI